MQTSTPHPAAEPHRSLHPAIYENLIPSLIPHHASFLESMLAFLSIRPGRVLELGSGTGLVTARIRALAPRAEIVCIDLSEDMIAFARAKTALAGVNFIEGDIRRTWAEGRFDTIITSLCLHHLSPEERSAVIWRAAGSLAPGGRFICGDVFRPLYRWEEKVQRSRWIAHMLRESAPEEIMQKMVAERESHYHDFDTVQTFRKRLQQSGFARTVVPFTSGFLAVVVGCVSSRGISRRYPV
jgi:SAM-dependent methyltransferase